VKTPADLFERGFQLAYFVVQDRSTALEILSNSLNKLKAHGLFESKRAYWRDKHLKRQITKISRSEADALQWLIYLETDYYEKKQEQCSILSAENLALRYVKALVRITTARSSFYVNIGLHRLLYNYSTAETQGVYEVMTSRFLGADEYRRAKLFLMRKLRARFGELLTTIRDAHGEFRFQTSADQHHWIELVHQCLEAFTPWSTLDCCLMPSQVHLLSGASSVGMSANDGVTLTSDSIESQRCHVLIHPACNQRLLQSLRMSLPVQKLAMPLFCLDGDSSGDSKSSSPRQMAPLSEEERTAIENSLLSESSRRRRAFPKLLRILVDRSERVRCQASNGAEASFEIGDDAELIEIWTEEDGKELLLGTHLIRHTERSRIAATEAFIHLGMHHKLVLTISPCSEASPSARGAAVSLMVQSISSWDIWKEPWRLFGLWRRTLPTHAVAVIALLLIGWAVTWINLGRSLTYQHKLLVQNEKELSAEKNFAVELRKQIQPQQARPELSRTFSLVPDRSITRGATSAAFPEILVPTYPTLINLEIPLDSSLSVHYRATLRSFLKGQSIIIENGLIPSLTPSGPVLVFQLPSLSVKPALDYTIEISVPRPNGQIEIIDSFTFHVRPPG